MRALIAIVLLCVGCNEHGKRPPGAVDAPMQGVCSPSGGCPQGPACGVTCCGSGEQCVKGVCMCGTNPACMNGDTCQTGGPAGPAAICGVLCCGGASPCPI